VLHGHVVVTGAAGAGKSTLALSLAATLGTVVLSKDKLKEALYEVIPTTTTAESLRLSAAAMAVLYKLAHDSGSGVVLDANWRVEADVALLEDLARPLVQVFCDVAPALARQRLIARVKSQERHPVHRDAMDPEVLASMVEQAGEPGQPLPITGPVLRVIPPARWTSLASPAGSSPITQARDSDCVEPIAAAAARSGWQREGTMQHS